MKRYPKELPVFEVVRTGGYSCLSVGAHVEGTFFVGENEDAPVYGLGVYCTDSAHAACDNPVAVDYGVVVRSFNEAARRLRGRP